eukprot:3292448-Pyramimonas_sp.AAC.1
MIVHCDNLGTVQILNSGNRTTRSKHVEIKIYDHRCYLIANRSHSEIQITPNLRPLYPPLTGTPVCSVGDVADVIKSRMSQTSRMPLKESLKRTLRFHMGSVALGAFIIAIVEFVRVVLHYMKAKAEQTAKAVANGTAANFVGRCFCYVECCLCCLDVSCHPTQCSHTIIGNVHTVIGNIHTIIGNIHTITPPLGGPCRALVCP